MIEIAGTKYRVSEIAANLGISRSALYKRLSRGWDIRQAVASPATIRPTGTGGPTHSERVTAEGEVKVHKAKPVKAKKKAPKAPPEAAKYWYGGKTRTARQIAEAESVSRAAVYARIKREVYKRVP